MVININRSVEGGGGLATETSGNEDTLELRPQLLMLSYWPGMEGPKRSVPSWAELDCQEIAK